MGRKQMPIAGAYRRNWMFSRAEKNAYWLLKPLAEQMGYILFAKVKLEDIVNAVEQADDSVTLSYRNKISQRHVDFVFCDCSLVAKYIIELDDPTHDDPRIQEADKEKDRILKSVHYPIIRIRDLSEITMSNLKFKWKVKPAEEHKIRRRKPAQQKS